MVYWTYIGPGQEEYFERIQVIFARIEAQDRKVLQIVYGTVS